MKATTERPERTPLALPARITWKDSRGTTRFASVMTRDISDTGVFIEWREPVTLPLYRLVTFQIERDVRNMAQLPTALRTGKVLSAVYRSGASQRSTGTPDGYGLRMLIEPATTRSRSAACDERVEATA